MIVHRPFNFSYVKDNVFYKVSKSERLADEIFYYQQIQNKSQHSFAEFIGDFSDGENYILGLKYYYNYLNLFEFIDKYSDYNLVELSSSILNTLNTLHGCFKSDKYVDNTKILIDKTNSEFDKFLLQNNLEFKELLLSSQVKINNKYYDNFIIIWDQIKNIIIKNYLKSNLSVIHGDFCFANMLINPVTYDIKLIDPRGSYHVRGCFGNASYDYAKLFHSIFGNYESIIYNQFEIKLNSSNHFDLQINKKNLNLEPILLEKIDPLKFKEYKLIEGLLFISMCSRHYTNKLHQMAMYLQGVMILNEFLEN